MHTLEQSVLKTLAYFDVFRYPLTREELYGALYQDRIDDAISSYAYFLSLVDAMIADGQIYETGGYCMLFNTPAYIGERERAVRWIEKKILIARRAARALRYVPFLQAIFLCNSVASSAVKEDSDIDVFIVIQKGRLWMTRFFITGLLHLLRLRRTKKHVANKICLSFYVTDDHLDLSDVALDDPDVYLLYWIHQLIPLYDPYNLFSVLQSKNQWVRAHLPDAPTRYALIPRYRTDDCCVARVVRHMFTRLSSGNYGNMWENYIKKIQKKKMDCNYGSLQYEPDSRVVINDTMLKFHENDRRAFYRQEWIQRCQQLETAV